MAKLMLQPKPTFEVKVELVLPGGEKAELLATFKHRTRDQLRAWLEAGQSREDDDTVLEMLVNWDIDAQLDRDEVHTFNQNYIGAAALLVETYIKELSRGRLGN